MKAGVCAYFFFTVGTLVWGHFNNFEEMRPKGFICNEEISFTYHYMRYHPVSNIANFTGDGLRLDFKVRTKDNAHILFSEMPFPSMGAETYEIVLGANQNKNSDIRRGKGTTSKQRISTPNIVSHKEARGFWIYIHNDGRILVGKEKDTMPILMWKDTKPIKVRFISFATWRDSLGYWFYNCQKSPGKEEEEGKDEVVTTSRPLTWTEKLRNDLQSYDTFAPPNPSKTAESGRTEVFAHLSCRHVELDEKRSVIDVYGTLSMSWTDERLKWSPEDYGNVTEVLLQTWEAWIPDIMLYNAASQDLDYLYGVKDVGLIVSHDGTVFWSPHAHFVAFCGNIDLRKWPKDIQRCELRLGFWSQQHALQMSLWENVTYLEDNRFETEWKVADVSAETVWIRTPWASAAVDLGMDITLLEDGTNLVDPIATDDSGQPEIVVHTSMAITLTLERRNSSYNAILLIPLAMILIFTLLSFWALPLGPVKLALQCLSLVMETIFLLATWRLIPTHADHIPSIVSAYQTAMIMTCISIVATVMIICFTQYPPVRNLPTMITLVLTSEWITALFFLPSNGEQVNVKYNSLDETPQVDNELSKDDDQSLLWNWTLLSTIIDRTMFFIYTILFFYIFSAF